MKYEMRDPRTIQPSPWNSNVVSYENAVKLKASLQRLGVFKPILVREATDGVIQCVGGWHRNEQAIELGLSEVPTINLGLISDEKAKEISLADNARYGIDDTLALSELLEGMDLGEVEHILPWSNQDLAAMTASLGVDIDSLDLDDDIILEDDADEPEEAPAPKAAKTHQIMRFRPSLADAARISALVTAAMKSEGFTTEDDLTNAGTALAFLLLNGADDV